MRGQDAAGMLYGGPPHEHRNGSVLQGGGHPNLAVLLIG
jgi:hypothetical protein